jgi:hypothetical protein
LSPLLFILVMESLSILIKKAKEAGTLTGIQVTRLTKILHLLFVDDVLILTKACLKEWTVISDLLKVFQNSTGLQINEGKSTFFSAGMEETDLLQYKDLFPFGFESIDLGLKYLGYFLKPNCYNATDWGWLLKKFEKRLDHWCNRWLTLGGRLVLIKAVLISQPVFWMSLAPIPSSILNRLCQLIYSFLWSGGKVKKHFHLCNWDSWQNQNPLEDGG